MNIEQIVTFLNEQRELAATAPWQVPELCPDVSLGETYLAPETASAQGHTAPLCPVQPIGLAEEE